jgi:hypothetical protein
MTLDLSDEKAPTFLDLLSRAIDKDRYPLSPHQDAARNPCEIPDAPGEPPPAPAKRDPRPQEFMGQPISCRASP